MKRLLISIFVFCILSVLIGCKCEKVGNRNNVTYNMKCWNRIGEVTFDKGGFASGNCQNGYCYVRTDQGVYTQSGMDCIVSEEGK